MSKKIVKAIMVSTALFFMPPLLTPQAVAEEVEIGGLLLNNTISRLGHEFAYKFSQLWQDIPNTQGLNVHIKEQVVPRAGTRLTINMNNRIIYVTYLGRRQSSIQERVEQAVFIVIEAIAQSGHYADNPDMSSNGW